MKNVTNTILPVTPEITNEPTALAWNMDDVKNYLQAVTEKYANLVVTDENVEDSQKALREVVSFRTGLKKFEREGKQLLNQPSHLFKSQCDELAIIIEDVEKPLRKQLDRYETQRLESLDNAINSEFDKKAEAAGLKDAYIVQFNIDKRWYNKTAKWSETTIAIDREVSRLLAMQTADEEKKKMIEEKREMVKAIVAMANSTSGLATPLNPTKYLNMANNDIPFNEIKEVVEADVKRQKEIELAARQEAERREAARQEAIRQETEWRKAAAREPSISQPAVQEPVINEHIATGPAVPEIPTYNVNVIFYGVMGESDLEHLQEKLDSLGFEYELKGVHEA